MEHRETNSRRTWAEIDLGALRHNIAALRAPLPAGTGIMAVVKANAYGHGVRGVVGALADRVEMFGVANVVEAREVRKYAPAAPVLILGPALPDERRDIVEHGFIPSVSDLAEAAAFAEAGGGRRVPIHAILDTGMGRIGVWQDEALAVVREIQRLPGIEITGIASHLPVADEDEAFTQEQIARFRQLAEEISMLGLGESIVHIANSASALRSPESAGGIVRAGLAMYGSAPLPEFQAKLLPALTWKSRVTLVRDVGPGRGVSYGRTFITPHAMRIATIGVGYADGYQRHLSNRGADVLIGGKRCPVLGRVTMDQILADGSAVPNVQPGDEVVLIGRQGGEEILVAELARKAGTIAWEIFTGIGLRVERVYA